MTEPGQDSGGVPEQAVEAAEVALTAQLSRYEVDTLGLIEAAAPAIRAQERERILEALLDNLQRWTISDVPGGVEEDSLGGLVKFADLLNTLGSSHD